MGYNTNSNRRKWYFCSCFCVFIVSYVFNFSSAKSIRSFYMYIYIYTYVHIYKYACVHVCSDSGYICIYMCVCIYLSVSLWVQRDARKVFLLSVYTYVIGKCVPSLLLTGRCHTQTSLARARAPLRSRQLQNVSRFSRNYFVLFFFFFLPFFFLLLHRSALFDSFGKINQSVVSLLSLRVLGWFFVARALSRIASRRDEDSFDDERLQEKRAIAKKNPVKLSVWLSVWCSDVKKRKKKNSRRDTFYWSIVFDDAIGAPGGYTFLQRCIIRR